MNIGAIGGSNSFAQWEQSSMNAQGIGQAIGMAVMKQIQDAENNQAQALIKMMENVPTPNHDGLGSIINIQA